MPNFTPKIDAAYREYAEAQLHRHFLVAEGKADSDEAAEVEERLALLWESLDDTQRRSLNGMASDLNWLQRRGTPPPKGRAVSDVTHTEWHELEAAQDSGDWYAILHHLRVCAPGLPRDLLAYTRATCYHMLGYSKVAAALADLTVELSRGNSQVGRLAFDVLASVAPGMAFHRAAEIMSSAPAYPPVLVAQSIGYVLDTLGANPALFDAEQVTRMLQEAHRRLETSPASAADRARFYHLAGAEMQTFGQEREARELYEQALRLEPENPIVLARLGMLLYNTDAPRAAELFKKAVHANASFLAPYLLLAHYHLLRREFADAFQHARQAMDFATDDRARAALLEVMAISASELGEPTEVVLKMISEAARLAPNSTRIGENLKAFLKSRHSQPAKADWKYQEDRPDYAVREPIIRATVEENKPGPPWASSSSPFLLHITQSTSNV